MTPDEWWNLYCQRMAEPGPGRIRPGWWFAALLVGLAMWICIAAGLRMIGDDLLALFD
ncbi:MAG: hypothetical protein ABTQ27_09605 [Amaricoccus sp.]|uniref:hypothetical protein n=1 Tax=Amaricoccus sp. TaxID=1872485 RepID=UPI00331631FA